MKKIAIRKTSVFMLLFLLLVVSALTGCKSSKEVEKKSSGKDDGSLTLSYWVSNNRPDTLKDYNEMGAYKKLQEVTDVKVEFQHPASGEADQQFNLMMASGELPDVIERIWPSVPGGPEKYIKDKKIVRLNDYIDQHAPNLKKILEENPEWKKMISTDDGSIYSFPFLRQDEVNLTFFGPVLRKDWLDKLGLETPETIDEWHKVLTAFKEQDPNGNGEADEIPLLIDKDALTSNAFVGAFGITNGFYQVDSKVKYGPIQPEYKEFLTLMNKWYEEGLIDKEYVATDDNLKDAKVTNDQLGALMGYTGSSIMRYMQLKEGENPDFKLTGAQYPVFKKGEVPAFNLGENNYNGVGAAITTSNKNIEETVKWMDYKYGEEGFKLFNFGIEGESYEMIDGYPTYTEIVTDNPDGKSMSEGLAMYVPAGWSGPFIQAKEYAEQYTSMPEQQEAIEAWKKGSNERIMPMVSPTQEESSEYASIMNDIGTYKSEMINKFIMGEEPLSKFDDFVKTINSMGIDKATEIQQAALERYNKR
ncbi:extracellular solute-binding protein [Lederbergia lenta]|uniref:Sugar ABC transporter substrate-binding protein n=1 Tax=Lederbergia lenta TaxID=1467 RepID=A0A2X4VNX3_LEDLE|nr:extracellular solute-binding protein [Lederbergia lenta]MCM3110865.1 extracellular solute-binding protein [Lederbergia lenta]MEC2325739.1 extracellular solute-binding protein [Lederbergia lenta]SQI53826.1 sugar ABC transporter substrate-binding protein [Lederbergia lenta]